MQAATRFTLSYSLVAVVAAGALGSGCKAAPQTSCTDNSIGKYCVRSIITSVNAVAVQNSTFFYETPYYGDPATAELLNVAVSGGTAVTMVETASTRYFAPVALDQTNVYWFASGGVDGNLLMQVGQAPGSSPLSVKLGDGVVEEMVSAGGNLYFLEAATSGAMLNLEETTVGLTGPVDQVATGALSVLADANNLYWSTQASILEMTLASGAVSTVVSAQAQPFLFALDSVNLYWTFSPDPQTVGIAQSPIAGGVITILVEPTTAHVGAGATDGVNVYFGSDPANDTTGTRGVLINVPVGGGTFTTMATGLTYPSPVGVDSSSAYFLSGSEVMTVSPP